MIYKYYNYCRVYRSNAGTWAKLSEGGSGADGVAYLFQANGAGSNNIQLFKDTGASWTVQRQITDTTHTGSYFGCSAFVAGTSTDVTMDDWKGDEVGHISAGDY